MSTEAASTKQKTRRAYQITGIHKARAALKQLEPKPLDGRTRTGKLRAQLVRDMGGKNISTQSRILAEAIIRAKLLHDRVTDSLATLPVVNRRRKTLYPAVTEAVKLTDSLARLVALAGTDKTPELDLAMRYKHKLEQR